MFTPVQFTISEVEVVVQFNVEKSAPVCEILYLQVIVSPSDTDSGRNVAPPGLT